MMERRYYGIEGLEVREEGDGSNWILGYPAVFNSFSLDLGGFREQIAPGAFQDTAERDDIRALFNHDSNYVLGRTKNGTLRLEEDERGLLMRVMLPDTTFAKDLVKSITRGDISGGSFGFTVPEGGEEWAESEDGPVRTLRAVNLYDVGPVTYPAYPATDVSVAKRSLEKWARSRAAERERRIRLALL